MNDISTGFFGILEQFMADVSCAVVLFSVVFSVSSVDFGQGGTIDKTFDAIATKHASDRPKQVHPHHDMSGQETAQTSHQNT